MPTVVGKKFPYTVEGKAAAKKAKAKPKLAKGGMVKKGKMC